MFVFSFLIVLAEGAASCRRSCGWGEMKSNKGAGCTANMAISEMALKGQGSTKRQNAQRH